MEADNSSKVETITSDPKYPTASFGMDNPIDNPMDRTDDILTGDKGNPPVNTPNDGNIDPSTSNENVDPNDPNDPNDPPSDPPADPNDPEPPVDNTGDLADLSEAGLVMKLLEDNGFKMYEELDKGLTWEDLAKDIPEYINQAIDNGVELAVQAKMEKYDKIAEYIKLVEEKGIPTETLNPAIQVEKYANFDIDNPNATEADLSNLVKEMYLRKGLGDTEAEGLAKLAKAEGRLKEAANQSKEFHKEYINNIRTQALRDAEMKKQRDAQVAKQQQEAFVSEIQKGTLGNLPISKQEQQLIFNTRYNKDQLVTYKDANGNDQKAYVTKFDLGMYQIQQDPSKLALLTYLIANDFDISSFNGKIKNQISKNIIDELENRSARDKQTRSNSRTAKSPTPVSKYQSQSFGM